MPKAIKGYFGHRFRNIIQQYLFIKILWIVWHIGIFRFSGFTGEFGVFYELGQYDLLYTLWDRNMSMKHCMAPLCIGCTPEHPENQVLL